MLLPLKSLQPILSNEKSYINYLIKKEALDSQSICNSCSSLAKRYEKCKLKVNEILQIGYYWLAKTLHISIKTITGHSPNTITYYTNPLVGLNLQETQNKIRDPKIIVEIDETKIGKRKHNHSYCAIYMIIFGEDKMKDEIENIEEIMDREEINKREEKDEEEKREGSVEEIENKNNNNIEIIEIMSDDSIEIIEIESDNNI
ncbi:25730_t:CDS:2 [Dentiscutata erythropus]|uniref:25730_t:CDS:1 n=1 Tax=Dentiscutata erythropus TaxID=1348616 RepID=A0A9N9FUG7_9GLOM|nr:25730_t:CDS:2 [Dentiscutata erythropus]